MHWTNEGTRWLADYLEWWDWGEFSGYGLWPGRGHRDLWTYCNWENTNLHAAVSQCISAKSIWRSRRPCPLHWYVWWLLVRTSVRNGQKSTGSHPQEHWQRPCSAKKVPRRIQHWKDPLKDLVCAHSRRLRVDVAASDARKSDWALSPPQAYRDGHLLRAFEGRRC